MTVHNGALLCASFPPELPLWHYHISSDYMRSHEIFPSYIHVGRFATSSISVLFVWATAKGVPRKGGVTL